MSARERLINILSGGHDSQKGAMGAVADEILDAHANELADQIVAEAERLGAAAWAEPTFRAAELIRPEGMSR